MVAINAFSAMPLTRVQSAFNSDDGYAVNVESNHLSSDAITVQRMILAKNAQVRLVKVQPK